MEKVRNPKIFLIAGKARHGKDTIGDFIEKFYHDSKTIRLQYSYYIKEYAKRISNWDGSEETKPRELLQQLGTDLIREQIDEMFFVKRMCEDIEVYSYFFDVIIISDVRLVPEITVIQEKFKNVVVLHVERPNFETELSQKQQQHKTETGLDHFDQYDYRIINDDTLDTLQERVNTIVKEVEENEFKGSIH